MRDDEDGWVQVAVGRERVVPFEMLLSVHEMLAVSFRAHGLEGHELDRAIVCALPSALAAALEEHACRTATRH